MIRLAVSRAQRVHVAVVEPGQETFPAGVDDLRARPDQRLDLIVGPDRLDPVAADGDSLDNVAACIKRDHVGVADDQVGIIRGATRLTVSWKVDCR